MDAVDLSPPMADQPPGGWRVHAPLTLRRYLPPFTNELGWHEKRLGDRVEDEISIVDGTIVSVRRYPPGNLEVGKPPVESVPPPVDVVRWLLDAANTERQVASRWHGGQRFIVPSDRPNEPMLHIVRHDDGDFALAVSDGMRWPGSAFTSCANGTRNPKLWLKLSELWAALGGAVPEAGDAVSTGTARSARKEPRKGRPCPECKSEDTVEQRPMMRDATPTTCKACGHQWRRGWR